MRSELRVDEPNGSERRQTGIPAEKMVGYLISSAALAVTVYLASASFLDRIQRDIESIAREQSNLRVTVEAYYREREPWIKRLELLEARCSEIRERLGGRDR